MMRYIVQTILKLAAITMSRRTIWTDCYLPLSAIE